MEKNLCRENKNGVCPTLTANMGTGGHNVPLIKDDNGIRKLTPRECFNLRVFQRILNFQMMYQILNYTSKQVTQLQLI